MCAPFKETQTGIYVCEGAGCLAVLATALRAMSCYYMVIMCGDRARMEGI